MVPIGTVEYAWGARASTRPAAALPMVSVESRFAPASGRSANGVLSNASTGHWEGSKIFESGSRRRMSYRKLRLGLAMGVAMCSTVSWAQAQAQQTTDQKVDELEKKVEALEKEVKADQTVDSGQNAAVTTADPVNGFVIKSKDGNFVLHIGADVQVDNHTYFCSGSSADTDSIVLRRV